MVLLSQKNEKGVGIDQLLSLMAGAIHMWIRCWPYNHPQ
jgi:hypothetical protein